MTKISLIIEVSYELENVFTDIFCGHIEDKQLRAYFLNDQVEIGLVAVLEEIEKRAQIKHQANYTVAGIDLLDAELLSGGAGAKRQLTEYQQEKITLEGDDIYRIEDDLRLAQEIRNLESAHENDPQDFKTVMQLGKLYTITSLSAKKRIAFLKKARELNQDSPEPYKYLGIAHLDAFYQFESAIKEMSAYTEQRPYDVFGHNYLGYLYFCVQKYRKAISELNRAIELKPDNCVCGSIFKICRIRSQTIRLQKESGGEFAEAGNSTPEPRES